MLEGFEVKAPVVLDSRGFFVLYGGFLLVIQYNMAVGKIEVEKKSAP